MQYVCVGDDILASTTAQESTSLLRGHGVLERRMQSDSAAVATRCGIIQRWNQLVLVDALTGSYTPAVGHVVVGRVVQVGSRHLLSGSRHLLLCKLFEYFCACTIDSPVNSPYRWTPHVGLSTFALRCWQCSRCLQQGAPRNKQSRGSQRCEQFSLKAT